MATFKTRRDLIDQVLDNLGVLVPGQAPSDADVSRVDGILDPVLAMLAAEGFAYVPDAGTGSPPSGGEIDNAIFIPLASCVAWRVAGGFNLAGDPALKVINDDSERMLVQIGRPARGRRTLRIDTQIGGNATYRRGYGGDFTRGT